MKKIPVIFGIVLLLQLINLFIWSGAKEGYYIDELWSFGLANSYYEPFLNEIEGHEENWHDPSYYQSYLVVDEGEAFSYLSVYDNQVQDVHPPLYYFLLHTVCSFFPGIFSKWFGLSLNLVFFAGAMWILFQIGRMLWGEDSLWSILPVCLYGFSLGAMNTVLYVRMYMMLVFFALLFVYLSMLWWKRHAGYSLLIGLALTAAGGFLTQYFFIIFIFFVVGAMVFWQLFLGRWRSALKYGMAVLAGLVVAVALFPASLSHVLRGDKGQQVLSQATGALAQYGKQFLGYSREISEEILGLQQLWPLLIVLLLVALLSVIIGLIKAFRSKEYDSTWVPAGLLIGAVVGYFVVVVKIAPEVATRYQCMIYPFLWGGILYPVWCLCKKLRKEWLMAVPLLVLLVLFGMQYPGGMKYLYPGMQQQLDLFANSYGKMPGYYVTEESYDHVVINDCPLLMRQEATYVIDAKNLDALQLLKNEQPDEIVVYVSVFYQQKLVKELMELWEYDNAEEVMTTEFTKVMVFHR